MLDLLKDFEDTVYCVSHGILFENHKRNFFLVTDNSCGSLLKCMHSGPPLSLVSLSMVSVTHGQLQFGSI